MTQAAPQLIQSLVRRIETLEEQKDEIKDDIASVYAEAKSEGLDVKILRKLIAIRKQDEHEREEEDMLLETYMSALGMAPQFEEAAE